MRKIFFLFIPLSILISCSDAEETAPSVYDDVELKLNDGKKWDVSDNMMMHMAHSFFLIEDFDKTKSADYQPLIDELIEEKDLFVSSCDMGGEGHDVLHEWLIPYMGLLEDFDSAKSTEEEDRVFNEIKVAKTIFNKYFE